MYEITIRVWDEGEDDAGSQEKFCYLLREHLSLNLSIASYLEKYFVEKIDVWQIEAGVYEAIVSDGKNVIVGCEIIDTKVRDAGNLLKEAIEKYEWAEKALLYFTESSNLSYSSAKRNFKHYSIGKLHSILMAGFVWSETPEPPNYWNNIYGVMVLLNE